jgi:hypothetical protein
MTAFMVAGMAALLVIGSSTIERRKRQLGTLGSAANGAVGR